MIIIKSMNRYTWSSYAELLLSLLFQINDSIKSLWTFEFIIYYFVNYNIQSEQRRKKRKKIAQKMILIIIMMMMIISLFKSFCQTNSSSLYLDMFRIYYKLLLLILKILFFSECCTFLMRIVLFCCFVSVLISLII